MAVSLCHVTLPLGVTELFGVSASEAVGIEGKIVFTPQINEVVSTGGGLGVPKKYDSFVKNGQWVDRNGDPGLWFARPDSTDRTFVYSAKVDLDYRAGGENLVRDFFIAVPAAGEAILTEILAVSGPPSTFITKGDKGDKGDQGPQGIQGPQGAASTVPGPQGLPGVNAVDNDTAVGTYVTTPGTATRTAIDAAVAVNATVDGKVKKGDLVFNVRDYGAVGNGATDDTAAIQAAINAASLAVASRGAVVFLPVGQYLISAPLILPRPGLTPKRVVSLRGASIRAACLLASSSFPAGRAMIEWEATSFRAWHQEISDMMFTLPLVTGTRAIHYKKISAGSAVSDFSAERSQFLMHDLLIEGSNGYHASLIKIEAQAFWSHFDRIYADNAPTGGLADPPITDVDTILFEFETSLYGGVVSSDMTGLSYSTIKDCVGSTIRRGGRGCLIKGKVKNVTISDSWIDGSTYDPGVYLLNSFNVAIRNVGNEGRSGSQIYLQGCVGAAIERVPLATQDPPWLDWVASTPYVTTNGVVVPGWRNAVATAPPANNNWYKCVSAGTSGSTQPAWPTTPGATVTDGTVTWQCVGPGVNDAIVIDGGNGITISGLITDPVKPTFTSRGCKAVRLKNSPINVRAIDSSVPGDPMTEVAWDSAAGQGDFAGARNGEHVRFGSDPYAAG